MLNTAFFVNYLDNSKLSSLWLQYWIEMLKIFNGKAIICATKVTVVFGRLIRDLYY